MNSLSDEVDKHQYFYLPWSEPPIFELGPSIALHLRDHYKARLTLLCPQLSNAPTALKKATTVTQRTGSVADGGVVLVYCPTYELMDKISHLTSSIVVLSEWPNTSFAGWAKLVGAYNVKTGATMSAELTSDAEAALDGLMFEGYKGWNDSIAVTMARSYLQDLDSARGYDRQLVLAKARLERGSHGTEYLERILDRFEAERA